MSAELRRVQLSHRELCQLKWMTGCLLALVSLWTLLYLEISSELLIEVTGMAIMAAMLWPSLPESIPGWVWKAVTPILILAVIADFLLARPDVIPPLVRMLILLVALRCLQHRRRREDLQLILLCLFMVMISGVLTLSLTFAVQILVFTPVAMGMLFLITLTESYEHGNDPPIQIWQAFHWSGFLSRIWQAQDFRLLAIAAAMFSGVLMVSSMIFVLMPRFQLDQAIPFLTLNSKKSRSGFSDRIEFGEVVEIIKDKSVALRVDVGKDGEAPNVPYWRMVVLDEYDHGVFQTSPSARAYTTSFNQHYFRVPGGSVGMESEAPIRTWTFYFEGGISKFLPVVGLLKGVRFQNRQSVEFNDFLHHLNMTRITSKVLSYQLESIIREERVPASALDRSLAGKPPIAVEMSRTPGLPNIPYPYTTLVVPGGQRNRATLAMLVREITGGQVLGPREFSARAVQYLQRRHRYALNVAVPKGNRDLMIRWLDSDRPGHCELFAGAFALLGRQAGYPTRIVTGFKGGTWNGYENYYMIRNQNAHAWCEVFDGDDAWFRVDPTPGSDPAANVNVTTAAALRIDRTWDAYLDSFRILWYRRIINFNESQQHELANQLKETSNRILNEAGSDLRGRLASIRVWIASPWNSDKWLMVLRLILLISAIGVVVRWLPGWLFRLTGGKGKRFGLKWSRDPIRREAGRLVVKFRTALPEAMSAGSVPAEGWDRVYRDLLNLRYGDRAQWPNPKSIFRQARALLKRTARVASLIRR